MTTLLQLHSSINGDDSLSSALADEVVARWSAAHPGGRVIRRDLHDDPVPHLDAQRFGAFTAAPDERGDAQDATVAYSDALIEELREADTLVLAVPMYNFSVPSTFKAWMDHVARAGVTFRYTDSGPVGLLEGKRAIVVASRGGRYAGTPADSHTPLLKTFLGFLGVDDVQFVYAEGTNLGAAARDEAIAAAHRRIASLGLENRAA